MTDDPSFFSPLRAGKGKANNGTSGLSTDWQGNKSLKVKTSSKKLTSQHGDQLDDIDNLQLGAASMPQKPRSPAKRPPPAYSTSSNNAPAAVAETPPSKLIANGLSADGSSVSGARQKASPGALLRMQSAMTHPAPHPIPELMRLTSSRYLIPMTDVIHSMASLSRGGSERGGRKTNQDACFAFRQYVQPYQAIGGVFDGHGPHGHVVSNFAKRQLPSTLAEQLKSNGEAGGPNALRAAFLQVQSALRASSKTINARLSGSTAVVSLLQGRRVTTAWAGDGRAVVVRKELGGGWRGITITQDHKPTSAGELSRILAAGGRVERLFDGSSGREVGPQRVWLPGSWVPGLAMSRALGDFVAQTVGVTSEPEVHSYELTQGDEYLVIGTDGIWEFLTAQEVAELMAGCDTAEKACKLLVETANQRWDATNEGIVDDISVVVTKLLPIGPRT